MKIESSELLRMAKELISKDVNMDYDIKMNETTKKLRELEKQLDKHKARQRRNPTSKIYIEDLDKMNESLNVLMRELG
jgi:hypothetical protein